MIGCMLRRLICVGVVTCGCAFAQGRGNVNWTTTGYDAQRSFWVRSDPKISVEAFGKQSFSLTWKLKLENSPAFLNSLTPLIVLDPYTGYRGHKSLGYLSGSSENIFSIDIDLGVVEWREHLSSGLKSQGAGTLACPGGMTSGVARPSSVAIQAAPAGRGGVTRAASAKGAVGEALQGAVNLVNVAPPPPMIPAAVPATPARPVVAPPNAVYAVSSDGMLQMMYVSNGADVEPPVKFVPPNSNVNGLIVVDNVAYAETKEGCRGAVNGLWALDLASKQVHNWTTNSGAEWGSSGPAFGPDGTLYVTSGIAMTALDSKSLRPKNGFQFGKDKFATSPIVFRFDDKILVAAATRDGGVHFVDSGSMAEVGHAALVGKAPFTPGALASWQDTSGQRWILAPTGSTISAWKVVVDEKNSPTLQPGWVSREMTAPVTPVIVNGVVFALASGDQRSTPAVLYALDGASGRELWNSGNTITSFVHSGGLSSGDSQIFLSTYDGTLYAFGFPIEH